MIYCMSMYTCPMHPEIKEDKPGKCPKCGMRLVTQEELHKSSVSNSYMPLVVIISLIAIVAFVLGIRDFQQGAFGIQNVISYFMIGFFLVFAGFKLIDLKGFAEGYATYDLLAQRLYAYGFIYPFIELFFGLAMIINPFSRGLLWIELIVMSFSGLGVAIKLAKKERFHCVCLGTFLKVPLTKVTLVEDFGMAALAAVMIALS